MFEKHRKLILDSTDLFAAGDTLDSEYMDKVLKVRDGILRSTKTSDDLYTGVEKNNIKALSNLELELFDTSDIYMEVLKYQHQDNSEYNKKIDNYIDYQIATIDSNLISLQTVKYLIPLEFVTNDDFQLAHYLAEERYGEMALKESWEDVKKQAENNNNEAISREADKMIILLDMNIESLDTIAELKFGTINNPEISSYVDEEEIALEKDKQEFQALRASYKDSFNNKIRNRLQKRENDLLATINEISQKYDQTLLDHSSDLIKQQRKYQIDLLNILFRESKVLDGEYDQLQKDVFGNNDDE